jgi:formylmethanofuran dehydrogenase subunit E
MVQSFHGYAAPGVVLGGVMVDLARRQLPPEVLFDAVCETRHCLPDAVQLLTPCTLGNGWLKVVNLDRFALIFYDKYQGEGVRVYLDPFKAEDRSAIRDWYLKLKPKKEQDTQLLLDQIKEAGAAVLGWQRVKMRPQFLQKRSRGRIIICPLCREAYPAQDGGICRACRGEAPYLTGDREGAVGAEAPSLRLVPAAQAVGLSAMHDMTEIIL